jgi:Zn-dependent M28 family amino/carboxypeptidase
VIAAALIALALAGPSADPGYRFARSLALAGPRPAGSVAERRAQDRVEQRFRAAWLRIGHDRFSVPGHGRSQNVIGIYDSPGDCLSVLLAHTDSVPPAAGADDNASGVGTLVALAPWLAKNRRIFCDVWLIATGAEERPFTGARDHLGALAAVRRVRRLGRAKDLSYALSLDEVGRGRVMHLRSPARTPRANVERRVQRAARDTGLSVRWMRDADTGNSDHREFELAGFQAAKLGVPDDPCRHTACDRASRLEPSTFPRVRRLLEQLLLVVEDAPITNQD